MRKARPFNPICGLEGFEDPEGAIPTNGLESGIPVREKMNINGCTTKVDLDDITESSNQDQGGVF